MNERRTNILVGSEVLRQIDDAQYVTHENGVMKIKIPSLPIGVKIGNILQLGYDTLKRALNFQYQNDAWKTVATLDDLAALGSSATWNTLTGKPTTYPSAWDTLTGKPSTYPPAAHTHPEYASGGTGTPVSMPRWRLACVSPLDIPIAASIWDTHTVTILLKGRLDLTDIGDVKIFLALGSMNEQGNFTSDEETFCLYEGVGYYGLDGTTALGSLPSGDVTILIVIGSQETTITINGTTVTKTKTKSAGSSILRVAGLTWFDLLAYWHTDPQTTSPDFLFDANAIENRVLPNVVKQKIGSTINHLTLTAPVMVYQQ